jgi:ADP-heptose:LPS heptosyltransferase
LNTTINPNKILVIRFSSLGDVVLTTAIYPNLKLKWPETELTVLTKAPYAPVFANNPHVNHVQIYDSHIQSFSELAAEIKKEKFDVIIDLQGNFRSWWIRFYHYIAFGKLTGYSICWLADKDIAILGIHQHFVMVSR